jgi:hypothetical protein
MVGQTSSGGVWKAVTEMFSSQSKARVVQLRKQLNKAQKENKTAEVYFNHIKNLADEMAAAGKPLGEDDVISYVLAGLNDEAYNGFVAAITALIKADKYVSLSDLYSNFCHMRLDLKIKTLLESLRLTLQLVVVVVATEVDAIVGAEASQISIVAMNIMAMSREDMSNTEIISVEVTIHVEEVMVAVVKALANSSNSMETHSSSSMEVTNLPVRFVARLVT